MMMTIINDDNYNDDYNDDNNNDDDDKSSERVVMGVSVKQMFKYSSKCWFKWDSREDKKYLRNFFMIYIYIFFLQFFFFTVLQRSEVYHSSVLGYFLCTCIFFSFKI